MSEAETMLWLSYRNKYGPVNPVRMYDRAGALTATQINNAHGGKAKAKDFMPYGVEETGQITTPEEFIKALGNRVKIGMRRKK